MTYNLLTLSYPTTGPSGAYQPAATFSFMTSGYTPSRYGRSLGTDIVHNKNGVFKYVYDNGPNLRSWAPFEIACANSFTQILGSAETQWAHLQSLWGHVGHMVAQFPDGVANVHWSDQPLEVRFAVFPDAIGDKIEYYATVQLEEA